jgi:hypothetical protein
VTLCGLFFLPSMRHHIGVLFDYAWLSLMRVLLRCGSSWQPALFIK